MLTMSADKWIFPLAVWLMFVSSSDEQDSRTLCNNDPESCETKTLSAPLGSSVLLPCHFEINNSWVSWVHSHEMELVKIKSDGKLNFLHPRNGRVKAFPNQGSKGNYSISIDDLEDSDLGYYCCVLGNKCYSVELGVGTDASREQMWLLIYICVGVAAFILLSVCSYLLYNNIKQDNTNSPVTANIEVVAGASAPPMEISSVPVHEQQRGTDNHNLVYENDDQDPANQQGDPTRIHCGLPGVLHDPNRTQPTPSTSGIYPNLNQFNFERAQSQRTKQRFHRELFNRLRQASFSRHYYANQGEISRQQAMSAQAENHGRGFGRKKAKDNGEYTNPIYNRSTDQLNRL
ncbi:uncharacterized protein LOC108898801 isoform X2 [Lates calcarifer]|uniref:Uncharacterized protein LOC108898801 isoform X2 n=1 Tax=Lates calcarifer TaxID=8187 RepID=A0AAJ8DJU3_LATCA|nr:uncharacterized protein LOC108898801 isoform X2 [Lates calcarifer]